MNTLKRTLALVAALAMTATAFASCGKKDDDSKTNDDTKSPASDDANKDSEKDSDTDEPADSSAIDASVGQGGEVFTVAAWNHNDVPALLAQWKGLDYDSITADLADDKVAGIKFIDMNVGGGDAAENYDQLFNEGGDLDVYFCEADWALKFINDDTKTLALDKLGLTDADFPDIYAYTDTIGKDSNGVRKGISWQAAAGGFGYREDLAKEYLGADSPEAMQEKIADWDKFVEAAKTVSEQSGGKVALADSLGGLWQAYACGRTTPWVVDNKLQIDNFCEEFANTAKALWDVDGVAKNGQWNADWTGAGVSGHTMGYFVSTWGFGDFFLTASGGAPNEAEGIPAGEQYGKWNVCRGPVEYYWGGTWIVVNPATDNGQEARDFIISATSDEAQMEAFAINKPEYVNNKKVMDKLIGADTVFNPSISGNIANGQNYFKEIAKNIDSLDFKGLITPYDATIKQDFIDAVQDEMLEGGKSYDDAVKAFEDKVYEDIPTLDE